MVNFSDVESAIQTMEEELSALKEAVAQLKHEYNEENRSVDSSVRELLMNKDFSDWNKALLKKIEDVPESDIDNFYETMKRKVKKESLILVINNSGGDKLLLSDDTLYVLDAPSWGFKEDKMEHKVAKVKNPMGNILGNIVVKHSIKYKDIKDVNIDNGGYLVFDLAIKTQELKDSRLSVSNVKQSYARNLYTLFMDIIEVCATDS